MEEIKVGEYVRTKNKGIQKIAYLRPNTTVNKYAYFIGYDDDGDRLNGILKTTDIVKHSNNITDLIEEGDIVNYTLWKEPDDFTIFCEMIRDIEQLLDFKFDIEENNITLNSILTKEQFKENCYKVGD